LEYRGSDLGTVESWRGGSYCRERSLGLVGVGSAFDVSASLQLKRCVCTAD
jgi:hypothetical protein